ncbi:hypothetical protein [Lacrimispora sp.]|uniref:hypothetical protein n=1 Tax=Lacrimispora sp. TaxID=2719234 RepID=UPI00289CA7D0|nr:hypothetical protein [Lacrimispora sp.]
MLQIITGKFYGENHKYDNEKNIKLYSNAKIESKCKIGQFEIEPIEYEDKHVNVYKIKFNNQIEMQSGSFSLIDIGSDVVIYQLKNALTFFMDCFFDEDEYIVNKICKEKKARTRTKCVPSNFLRTTLDINKLINTCEIERANKFLCDLVALKREDYENVMNCIRSYCASIRLLEEDPNLSYCMLIFALESLSQCYDKYEPVWEDYDSTIRCKIEKVVRDLATEKSQAIRDILTTDAHLRLTQRFLHFIESNVREEFYFGESLGNRILKDDIKPALKNAYNIRSKYAHALKIIIDQSTTEDASKVSDYYKHRNEPYFTYSGLLRLTRHVILNLVNTLEKVEKENWNWAGHMPGMIEAVLGPEFWLSKMEAVTCLGAKRRYEGFVIGLSHSIAYDIKDVMEMYMTQFQSLKEELKKPIFSLCVLWNNKVDHDPDTKEKYNRFIEKNKERFNDCCIENIVLFAFPFHSMYSIEWEEHVFENKLNEYISWKHKENHYAFPVIIETIMYLMASDFLKANENKKKIWEDKARYNSANDPEILSIVAKDISLQDKFEKIWDAIYIRNKKNMEG